MEIPPASASASAASPSKAKRLLAVQHKTMVRGTRASELRAEKTAAAAAAAAAASKSSSSSGTSTPVPSAPSTARSSLAHLPPSIALAATLPVPPVKAASDAALPLSQTASSAALKSKGVGVKKTILKPRYATMKPSVSAALTAAAAAATAAHPVLLTHANPGKLVSSSTGTRLTAPTASSTAKAAPQASVVLSDANPSPAALGSDKLAVPPLTLAPATSSPKLRPSAGHAPAPRAANGTAATGVPPRHSTSRSSRPPSANAHASSASSAAAAASSSSAIAASSRLSSVDREVLADISIIQDWLSSLKTGKRSNLLNFKDTIAQMKKTIFTPQQVTRARKAAGTTTTAPTGTKSGSSSTKKLAAKTSTLTAAQRAAAAAANALLSPLQRKMARLTATPLMTHWDLSSGDLDLSALPPAASQSPVPSAVDAVASASALSARASPPLLDGYTRDADDNSDYGDDFDPDAHADGSSATGVGNGSGDEFDSKLSSFLRKTTKRDEDFIRESTLSGQGQFAHVASVEFVDGRWREKKHAAADSATRPGAASSSSKSAGGAAAANQVGSDLDDDAAWSSETEHPAHDDEDDNALDHIPDFSTSRAMDNDQDNPGSHSPSSLSARQAAYRPGSGMGTAASRMRSSSNSQSTKRASTRGTGTLSRTSRATSSAISPAFDDTSDAVSVSMSGRSDSPSQLASFGGDAASPPATASSKKHGLSSPSSVSVSQRGPARLTDDLDDNDLDAIPDFDSEPPSAGVAADHKIVAPQPTVPTPSHSKTNSAIVAPFTFAQGSNSNLAALSPASHQKSRSIGFIPASAAAAAPTTLPPTVITVQSWTKNSAAPFVPVTAAAAAPPAASASSSSALLKKSLAADEYPDDLDGLDDDDDDQPTNAASRPPVLNKPASISTGNSSGGGGGSKMQTFTTMPVPGAKTPGAPGHVLTSSASLDDDDALELQLESRAMLSPASTTRSTLRSGMGGSGLDSEPDSASVTGPSSSSSSAGVNHSSRISLFSKALVKGSAHADDDFPSDLDDLSDTEFEDEDRAATLAASAPTAAIAASLGRAARELNEFVLSPALQATFSASEDAHQAALQGKLAAFTSPLAASAPLHAHVLDLLHRDDAITPAMRAAASGSSSGSFAQQVQSLLAEAAAGAKAVKALSASRRHTAGAKLTVPVGLN